MTERVTMPHDDDEATDNEVRSVAFGCLMTIGIVLATVSLLVAWIF